MYQLILVALDGSRSADLALNHAIMLAHVMRARIEAIHVTVDPNIIFDTTTFAPHDRRTRCIEAGHKILQLADNTLASAEVSYKTALLDQNKGMGHLASAIVAHSETVGADIIVIGTHGTRGIRHLLLGSVSKGVIRQSPKPVLVVRALEGS